jgi:hypothetical protein
MPEQEVKLRQLLLIEPDPPTLPKLFTHSTNTTMKFTPVAENGRWFETSSKNADGTQCVSDTNLLNTLKQALNPTIPDLASLAKLKSFFLSQDAMLEVRKGIGYRCNDIMLVTWKQDQENKIIPQILITQRLEPDQKLLRDTGIETAPINQHYWVSAGGRTVFPEATIPNFPNEGYSILKCMQRELQPTDLSAFYENIKGIYHIGTGHLDFATAMTYTNQEGDSREAKMLNPQRTDGMAYVVILAPDALKLKGNTVGDLAWLSPTELYQNQERFPPYLNEVVDHTLKGLRQILPSFLPIELRNKQILY